MEIVLGLENLKITGPAVVTVGTYDGVHYGHREIFKRVLEVARERRLESVLVTFEPHPKSVVLASTTRRVQVLTTLEEKLELLEEIGFDRVLVIRFTREFSEIGYREFVGSILIDKLKMQYFVIGYDHAFGRDRRGNFDSVSAMSAELGFEVERIPAFDKDGERVNSTRIRQLLEEGEVDHAARLLGRNYSLQGIVVKGDGRGKKLTFPTANLQVNNHNKLLPKTGVYAVDCSIKSEIFRGMTNIGYNPTFNGITKNVEVHILDFDRDIYGEKIELSFLKRLRDEKKFESKLDLIEQLKKDKIATYKI